MKQRRAIANIKNPVGRRLTLLAITPLIAILGAIVFVYAFFVSFGKWWDEFTYHMAHYGRLVGGGIHLAWLGEAEWARRENEKLDARLSRAFGQKGATGIFPPSAL